MAKLKPTPELLGAVVARVPEGFIHRSVLCKYVQINSNKHEQVIDKAIQRGQIERAGPYFYDPDRMTKDGVDACKSWCSPAFPSISDEGYLIERPIRERMAERENQLQDADAPAYVRVVKALDNTSGYAAVDDVCAEPGDDEVLDNLVQVGVLEQMDGLVYDPLRLSERTMQRVVRYERLEPTRQTLQDYLASKPGATAPYQELAEQAGQEDLDAVLEMGGFARFTVKDRNEQNKVTWVRLKGSDAKRATQVAEQAGAVDEEAWRDLLPYCGDTLRPGTKDGDTWREQVVARTYTVNRAAKHLNMHKKSIEGAVNEGLLGSFNDPEGRPRILAEDVERVLDDPDLEEAISGFEVVRVRDLATVEGVSYSTIRKRLRRLGINDLPPRWRDVRGQWALPETYHAFREKLDGILEDERRRRAEAEAEKQRQIEAELERERQEREELRERLLAAFPTWRHENRQEQHISLHVGPPNSGKTHDALEALIAAGSGWYLAPLRLLAFEIFDRLNQRGVPCNLLTGEENIPVEGATITAATIEMLNPPKSGECIIIDEAQQLADPDRGWAWTRALMEAEAPEIHVIAPYTAQNLIEKLAREAAIPYSVVPHERLAPIKVADSNWSLQDLPRRTILVAFSRRMVLHLKSELESMKRPVSVVYGSLPPEVRRRQADRFAAGETEVCVATDAVGMGLNLPADQVCFYEVEKFDGNAVRPLTPAEVQQIGGRAGRYGYSHTGEVGAVRKRDLRLVRKLFYEEPEQLTHARVAPSVEDLEMIPGSLAERLEKWAELESIPDSLRDALKTTDMTERIELARMLTDEQVAELGLEAAVRLINAPTRQSSRAYWHSCARAIIDGRNMPLPPEPPQRIRSSRDLETTESCISCADIYLWLANRREFSRFAADEQEVRQSREAWSMRIDDALLRKIDTTRRCSNCGRRLPRNHRYGICDHCFTSRF